MWPGFFAGITTYTRTVLNAFEMEWSDDLVLRLINLYQAKPCLYDVREKDYHNRQKKKLASRSIATELNVPGTLQK